jgi:hypothetical protein
MNNFNRTTLLIIGFFGVMALIVIIISVVGFFQTPTSSPSANPPTSAPTQAAQQPQRANPPVPYVSGSLTKVLSKMRNREALSNSDAQTRQNLIQKVTNQNTGTIIDTDTFTIEYLSSPDIFEGQIKTPDIVTAKQNAEAWLQSQGLSKEGICNLPFHYYLGWQATQALKGQNEEFNPLPAFCE